MSAAVPDSPPGTPCCPTSKAAPPGRASTKPPPTSLRPARSSPRRMGRRRAADGLSAAAWNSASFRARRCSSNMTTIIWHHDRDPLDHRGKRRVHCGRVWARYADLVQQQAATESSKLASTGGRPGPGFPPSRTSSPARNSRAATDPPAGPWIGVPELTGNLQGNIPESILSGSGGCWKTHVCQHPATKSLFVGAGKFADGPGN